MKMLTLTIFLSLASVCAQTSSKPTQEWFMPAGVIFPPSGQFFNIQTNVNMNNLAQTYGHSCSAYYFPYWDSPSTHFYNVQRINFTAREYKYNILQNLPDGEVFLLQRKSQKYLGVWIYLENRLGLSMCKLSSGK